WMAASSNAQRSCIKNGHIHSGVSCKGDRTNKCRLYETRICRSWGSPSTWTKNSPCIELGSPDMGAVRPAAVPLIKKILSPGDVSEIILPLQNGYLGPPPFP